MISKRKAIRISSICLIGVASVGIGLIGSSAKGAKKDDSAKKVNLTQEDSTLTSVESMLMGVDADTLDATVSEIDLKMKQQKKEKDEKELKEAEEKYKNNWVKGLDFRDYIDFDKLKNHGVADIKEGNIEVKENPDNKADTVGRMPKYAAGEVVGQKKDSEGKDWYQIKSGEVEGYVKTEYLATGEKAKELIPLAGRLQAYADCDVLNVREGKSTDEEIIDSIVRNETIPALAIDGDWIKVEYSSENKIDAYVAKEYAKLKFILKTATKVEKESKEDKDSESKDSKETKKDNKDSESSESTTGSKTSSKEEAKEGTATVSGSGSSVVAEAKKYLGYPYVSGGSSLTGGTDCSGFTMSIYSKFGVSLPHKASSQASYGTSVSLSALQPGDLVFYGSPIHHVAIYAGGGRIVHAANEKKDITTSSVNCMTPVKAVRLLK